MARIQVLPEHVVNRIAAGEVVERPASVVKELMENSLDAGADRIEVDLEGGGCRLIRVSDNGTGIPAEDLATAWLSHATSKLTDAEDLAAIQTMGFRGEALPSIGAVSQSVMTSRARGGVEGARVRIEGGRMSPAVTVGAPEGTTVEVRNLFYNTPARKKFLRTFATEQGHAAEAFTRIALAYPDIAFVLTSDGRQVYHLPGRVALLERIRGLFGDEVAAQLVPVQTDRTVLRAAGFTGAASLNRSGPQFIHTFLNGRYIRDKLLMRAIAEAYRNLLPSGRFPVTFLFLTIDPGRVDVNVHPCKIEVRFTEPNAVFVLVKESLDAALLAIRERAQEMAVPFAGGVSPAPPLARTEPVSVPSDVRHEHREAVRRAVSDFLQAHPDVPPVPAAASRSVPVSGDRTTAERPPRGERGDISRFWQACASYIIEETVDGINIIDQHALHERILYETLAAGPESPLQVQRLLVPDVVELRPHDMRLLLSMRTLLAHLGVEIEEFGSNALSVNAVPKALGQVNPGRLLMDLLDELKQENNAARRDETVRESIACRGAVKAGEPLTDEQIRSLLRQRDELHIAPVCPHGRPTTIHLSTDDLARRFQRK
jgi:DNA mismatch repair protein MutL